MYERYRTLEERLTTLEVKMNGVLWLNGSILLAFISEMVMIAFKIGIL